MLRKHPTRIAGLWMAELFSAVAFLSAGDVTVTGRVSVGGGEKKVSAANVVVWLTPLAAPAEQPAASQTERPRLRFHLVQKHKQFDPHILVAPVGSAVEFPNLDPYFHNVFSLFEGKRFDLGLYEAGSTRTVRFDRAGISYIFCNIHPEMSAVVVALETPYYAITDRAGEIRIPAVPPGRYRLEVWNERSLPEDLKSLSREITISENAASLGTLHLREASNFLLAHQNKYGRDYDAPTPSGPLYTQP